MLLAQRPHYKELDRETKAAMVSRIHLLTDDIHSEMTESMKQTWNCGKVKEFTHQ